MEPCREHLGAMVTCEWPCVWDSSENQETSLKYHSSLVTIVELLWISDSSSVKRSKCLTKSSLG